jgi:tRNA-2-methylthio-N6-dimethylallyladenosine synthase
VPDASISTDIITGFCSETEEEHQETVSLMSEVGFEMAYMYCYNERPGTPAAKRFKDDVPEEVKKRRLSEIIEVHRQHSLIANKNDVGKVYEVLIEGTSGRSDDQYFSRNSQNKGIVFDKKGNLKPGDYAYVKVTSCTSGTLIGELIVN